MKFGINTWVWVSPLTTGRLETLAPHIAELGFDWIELPLEGTEDIDYGRAAEIVRDSSLDVSACVAMGPDRDLIHPDASIRENGMAYVRDCIEAVQTIGGTNLVGPIYATVGRTWQQAAEERAHDLDILVSNLRALAEYAGDRGVVMGIEPLNRFETSFINLAEQVIEVVDRVDHPSCRIMLDTFHMNIEEKSLGNAIRAAGPRLCHVHACENDRGAPGSGNVDWGGVAQALNDIQYDGPVVIESFTPDVKSIARAAAIWRPLADSSDALAVEGQAFLRKQLA
ncbi:MAG: TIM barrel protein [Chloroflexi bacterium]|jgi:D-psicose/D-tagatose/L-ribulose 3-epimerase|nr:TIM barrel protein [Chloroflexota bacterium]